jgi:hypothetical protein
MTEDRNQQFIASLAADLTPVKPLASPQRRTLGWLLLVAIVTAGLAAYAGTGNMEHRLIAAPDLWLAATGSTLTAILAAIAAFQLSLPDRGRMWALLPLPAAAIWIAASGAGCLRTWLAPETAVATLSETENCLTFIVGFSLPLSAVLILMLRRGYTMYPNIAAAVAGLACAAAAATLLNFIHPFDASATDLGVHAAAVAGIILGNRLLGGRILATHQTREAM